MSKPIHELENLYPEVDYQAILAQMQNQTHPRRKLQELNKKGMLLRLKKGFYVLSKDLIGMDYSAEIVANLLYGPSYLSLEFALSYYNLIPEKVEHYTSITSQKNKQFNTPIGLFSYKHMSSILYPLNVTISKTKDNRSFLIATPEKALMDYFSLKFEKSVMPTKKDIMIALVDDIRIDLDELKKVISKKRIDIMKPFYRNRHWNKMLIDYLLEIL